MQFATRGGRTEQEDEEDNDEQGECEEDYDEQCEEDKQGVGGLRRAV